LEENINNEIIDKINNESPVNAASFGIKKR